jgi:peptidyl-dipeptidase Dcp
MHVRFRSLIKSSSADAALGIILAVTHIAAISVIAQTSPMQNSNVADNPLLTESSLPYHVPPFDKIKDEHFAPAIEAGMREQLKEVETVANNSEKPTFDNTIVGWNAPAVCSTAHSALSRTLTPATPIQRCKRSTRKWLRNSPRITTRFF